MSRKINSDAVRMACTDCGKKVVYYKANEADLVARIEKSSKSREDFIKSFKCKKCSKTVAVTPAVEQKPAEVVAAQTEAVKSVAKKNKKTTVVAV